MPGAKGRCLAHTANSETAEQEFESGLSDPSCYRAVPYRASVIARGRVGKGWVGGWGDGWMDG